MKKGNSQNNYLLIGGLVAIVAVVALVLNSNGNLEGAPVFETTDSFEKTCVDDDSENDFFKKGTVQLSKKVYSDYCDGDYLIQHHCKTGRNVRPLRHYECPNGCFDGACLR